MSILHSKTPLSIAETRENAFNMALTVLASAKQRHSSVGQHRAISRLSMGPYLLLQSILLPLAFCGALIWAHTYLFEFWRNCILFWASILDIPLQTAAVTNEVSGLGLNWPPGDARMYLPGPELWLLTFSATVLIFLVSFKMNRALVPLKYIIRIICSIQAVSLLYFMLFPNLFPYTISSHLSDMTSMGYVLLIASPIMLAFGYYVIDVSVTSKILHTLIILTYFIVMIPHQSVLHILILQHFSIMFMPVLYLCFGALFDVLIFVALYSWVVSTIPARATT